MSTLHLDKLPLPLARAIRAGKRMRIVEAGQTVATVEPQCPPMAASGKKPAVRVRRLTAQQWISTVGARLSARPDLNAALIVRQGRDAE